MKLPLRDVPGAKRTFTSSLGFGYRQRAQPHRVEQLKDRGVGADAERERKDRGHGKALVAPQQRDRESQVLPERVDRAGRCSSSRSPRARASVLPNFRTAASCAACGGMPRAMLSSVSMAMYDAISRAVSSSRRCAGRIVSNPSSVSNLCLIRGV